MLMVLAVPSAVSGQDEKRPVTEAVKTGSEKRATNSDITSQESGTADTTGESSQQEDASQSVSSKTVAEAASTKPPIPEINLLEKGLAEAWNYFSSDDKTELADAWILKTVDEQQQLICRGNPKGFLYTKTQYSNFRLTFEWKYITDPDSNSGVLIYTQKEPRLWPTAMQVQLHQPLAGCIFPGGDATSDSSTEPKGLARPIGEWNSCLIVSEGGKLSVEINGRKAGEVSGCMPSTGFIALQAEGSETHFRKLMLQVLPPPEATPAITAEAPVTAQKDKPVEQSETVGQGETVKKDKPTEKPEEVKGGSGT
ncbi:MAG: DUF1080 domain-containing protein [Fuerstiella sp.]